MPRKEWCATYNTHEIRVVYTWNMNLQLYIDSELQDERNVKLEMGFSPETFLSYPLAGVDGTITLVEVNVKLTFLSVAVKICVDGSRIGGDEF